MLFLTVVFIVQIFVYTAGASEGSAIFSLNNKPSSRCWDENEIVKLRARKLFEDVLPQHIDPVRINDRFVKDLIRYFRKSLRSVDAGNDHKAVLLKDAMADTLGAHLRSEILPAARLAFYSGNISHKNARNIHEFFDEMKQFLNTQGLGWREPQRPQRWSNITLAKIVLPTTSGSFVMNPCSNLVLKRDLQSCIHLPIPRLDDRENPSAVALPFKIGGLVSLTSPSSKNVLLHYYSTAIKCITHSSPPNCRKSDIASLNNDLWNWLKRDVAPHIEDEKLYTAFGGVLKVAAAVQAHKNIKARRNLFDDVNNDRMTWNPWVPQTSPILAQMDVDWGPIVYILVVVAIAVAFFLCQIILHFLCSNNSSNNMDMGYDMKGGSIASFLYERLSNNLQMAMPTKTSNTVSFSDQLKGRSKTVSLGSIRTQKVYDLNENTEKLMAIMSGNEMSESTSDSDVVAEARQRANSPPKLETSISEVKIEQRKSARGGEVTRGARYKIQPPKLAATTSRDVTDITVDRNPSDSLWTFSESASTRSESSTTSKYCSRGARRYSDSGTSVKLSSTTQINLNSYRTQSDDTK